MLNDWTLEENQGQIERTAQNHNISDIEKNPIDF